MKRPNKFVEAVAGIPGLSEDDLQDSGRNHLYIWIDYSEEKFAGSYRGAVVWGENEEVLARFNTGDWEADTDDAAFFCERQIARERADSFSWSSTVMNYKYDLLEHRGEWV